MIRLQGFMGIYDEKSKFFELKFFLPVLFRKALHSHEPLVRMQIPGRSTLFCNRHAVFSSVNSSQKSFGPHLMISSVCW